jgi:uncharacterized protein Yka (UPF0111/DUF47 family)
VEVAGLKLPWFFPETPDVLGMLGAQAGVTVQGLEALLAWAASGGDPSEAERVRDMEHAADDRKRDLRKALTEAFITPLDAEDLYTMSERLDALMNGAKDAVRESEVMGLAPDEYVAGMVEFLVDGVRQLHKAFAKLKTEGAGEAGPATVAADAAIKAQRHLERVYRKAASALIDVEDLREVMGRREVYRRVSRLSDMIVEVAERVWYATVKEG